jgi:hypothetical protein
MPNIPFPNVPSYPGVPALVRAAKVPTFIQVALGEVQTLLAAATQSGQRWGIFDSNGNQLGVLANGNNLFQSIVALIKGTSGPVLSTNAFEFMKETKISTFPVEGGSFAAYNKVIMPGSPTVTLALQGTESDRTTFLNMIDAACESTDLYSVVTPEVTYLNYSLERYSLSRRAQSGATLLIVEISLMEIRSVSAAFSTVQTVINQPQNPAATPQTSSGLVQPTAPPQSVLKSLYNLFPSLQGAN